MNKQIIVRSVKRNILTDDVELICPHCLIAIGRFIAPNDNKDYIKIILNSIKETKHCPVCHSELEVEE